MASESSTTPPQQIETKLIEEVTPMEQETIFVSKEVKQEENLKTEQVPTEANQAPKPVEQAVEAKIDDNPVLDVTAKDSVTQSHENGSQQPVPEAINVELVSQSVVATVAEVQEQPTAATVEEPPKVTHDPEPTVEVIEKPKELSDVPSKESEEVTVKDKGVDKLEPSVSEVELKPEEKSEAAEKVEKSESTEEISKPLDPPEDVPVKESETVAKSNKISVVASKEVEPVPVVAEVDEKPKEKSETTKQVESETVVVAEVVAKPEVEPESIVSEVEAKSKEVSEVSDKVEPESVAHEVEAKPKEVSEVPSKVEPESVAPEGEAKLKEVSEVPSKVKPESVAPEVEAKLKEVSEVPSKVEPESVAPKAEAKPKEVSEVTDKVETKSVAPEAEAKPTEVSEVTDKVEPALVVPEAESKPKEQSDTTAQVEKLEETTVKDAVESLAPKVVPPVKEPEETPEKDAVESSEPKHADKIESVIPEVEAKPDEQIVVTEEVEKPKVMEPEVEVKVKEKSAITEEVENLKSADPEVETKSKEECEVAEQGEDKLTDEKTESVAPVVEVKPEGETEAAGQVEPKESIKNETVTEEGTLANKVEDPKASEEEETSAPPLPDITVKAVVEDVKKETEETAVAELSPKTEVETEKVGEEKADVIKNVVSTAEVTKRSLEGGITGKGVEPVIEDKKEDDVKAETPPLVETSKEASTDEKFDEASTTVTESVQESGSAVKEEESVKPNEDKSEKENVEETEKSEVQDSEPSTKDVEDEKTSRDLPTEVPAKATQKQSNNILTKVKQSLVKAKKAIIGKSPNSKTITTDTKSDIKA